MTRCRLLLGVAGILLAAVAAWPLSYPVTDSRGNFELDVRHFGNLGFAHGETWTQPVPVEAARLSRLDIPYFYFASSPAVLEYKVDTYGGRRLAGGQLTVEDSRGRFRLPGKIYSGFFDGQKAGWIRIQIPTSEDGLAIVYLNLTRLDAGGGLVFYSVPAQVSGRPDLLERPGTALVVVTRYGPARPAVAKAPVYSERVSRLAPPWLPGPAPVILFALLVLAGLALARLTIRESPAAR